MCFDAKGTILNQTPTVVVSKSIDSDICVVNVETTKVSCPFGNFQQKVTPGKGNEDLTVCLRRTRDAPDEPWQH